jgi:ubiquinone/menaquinone biosynthesis C-methylase UbiE
MNFKDLAARYDAWYQKPLGALAHRLECEAIFALAEVKAGERAVDIGCGTGIYTVEAARRGARVIGVDPSMEMLAVAREKFRQAGLTGFFVCALAEDLPFRSERFDLVLSVTSLCFVRSPDRAIEQIQRVLMPGGRLVLGELNRWSLWAFMRRLKGLFVDTMYNQAYFWDRLELERLLQRKGLSSSAVRILLYFPPINQETFLKNYRFFETLMKRLFSCAGAFIAARAEQLWPAGPRKANR